MFWWGNEGEAHVKPGANVPQEEGSGPSPAAGESTQQGNWAETKEPRANHKRSYSYWDNKAEDLVTPKPIMVARTAFDGKGWRRECEGFGCSMMLAWCVSRLVRRLCKVMGWEG